jgi:hypothetical protein
MTQVDRVDDAVVQAQAGVRAAQAEVAISADNNHKNTNGSAAAATIPLIALRRLLGAVLCCVHVLLRAHRGGEALELVRETAYGLPLPSPSTSPSTATISSALGELMIRCWMALLATAATQEGDGAATGGELGKGLPFDVHGVAEELRTWASTRSSDIDSAWVSVGRM